MTTISKESLLVHKERVKGKVVLITGAAKGVGRAVALLFAKYGAKVVIGDLDLASLEEVVDDIARNGGTAICQRTDILDWDSQVALFELAIKQFGSVSVVIPCATVPEIGRFEEAVLVDGLPVKPNFKTLEINLISAMYTAHLALHYLQKNQRTSSLKAVVFLGSKASWQQFPMTGMYAASNHGMLGMVQSVTPDLKRLGARTCLIQLPVSASRLDPAPTGQPFGQRVLDQITSTIFNATTDPDVKAAGCVYSLLDDGTTLRLKLEGLQEGVIGAAIRRGDFGDRMVVYLQMISKAFVYGVVPSTAATLYFRFR